ncbi:MAG: hypothetical protein KUG62_06905, partial [Rhodobacteraceae bacterium]|nr:hypothetical protein [Paracoccaceae bacterium]
DGDGGSGGGASGGGDVGASGGSGALSSISAASAAASSANATSGASDGTATISARDHRRAQKAVFEGRALPLNKVMSEVYESLDGNLVSIRYRESDNTGRYIFKVVTNDGRLVEINVDARTAKIIEGRG